ncbi:peptidase inhibitor R3HDML-like isoform X2 [Coregonus clupeaformis]|uniref:peptidase inhibitor R3HDML-like isoform X2 n=1 Tax=Coregonus clupeaformis TaxID=59861 RepID=UPI001BE01EBC|nr:peptidase inhibitor R3HDML-like isoform X2 [Coregonus clupeaformis]
MKKSTRTLCCQNPIQRVEMGAACAQLLFAAIFWSMPYTGAAVVLSVSKSNQTDLLYLTRPGFEADPDSDWSNLNLISINVPRSRKRRAISSREMNALLDYHNRVRSQVFPQAANMEIMVWDGKLAKSADSWASRCIWDHGPSQTMRYMGQNLSINSGRYRSVIELVRSWQDEKYSFSYPNTCSGPVCSHYTQMVWANTNRMGCAINKCSNMNVYGSSWRTAVFLVCNYSIK